MPFLSFAVALLGLLGGLFSYILGLRIRYDILSNNKRLDTDLQAVKDSIQIAINNLRNELTREIGAHFIKQDDKQDRMVKEIAELATNLNERILAVVDSKYVRTDLHTLAVAGLQERFTSMRELITVTMTKIETGLDRQILDLKERIPKH